MEQASCKPADAPTPLRQRSLVALGESCKAGEAHCDAASSGKTTKEEWRGAELPAEARDLTWPDTFCDAPRGERLELSEEGTLVKRTSGVGHGIAFIGPLSLDHGLAYFEVEVAEMEPKTSQTLAIGLCCSLPTAKVLRVEKARDLGQGSFVLGYDLPKVYANGAEVAKINTKQWRPLKELAVGDRVGLLIERAKMSLTVFVNGNKKASAEGLGGDGFRWPNEVYGVIDVHGTVRATWVRGPAAARRRIQRVNTVEQVPAVARLVSTQDVGLPAHEPGEAQAAASAAPLAEAALKEAEAALPTGTRRGNAGLEASAGLKKRLRMTCHPCGCLVHLIRHTGDVVHVPRKGDFVIGRNPMSCNVTLDSSAVPNMVSRRHAVIVSADDAVILQDCESLNGTFVNGRRVGRETLRQGDVVMIGNPTKSPVDFQFNISMPPAA